MDLREMLRGMRSDNDAPKHVPKISHVGQIARLREFSDRLDNGCPFTVGEVVTPRVDGCISGVGEPHLVVEVECPVEFAEAADVTSNYWGARNDMRVACMTKSGQVAMCWVESVYFETYSEAHAKADPEREYEAPAAEPAAA